MRITFTCFYLNLILLCVPLFLLFGLEIVCVNFLPTHSESFTVTSISTYIGTTVYLAIYSFFLIIQNTTRKILHALVLILFSNLNLIILCRIN